jgi:hypothetical protein
LTSSQVVFCVSHASVVRAAHRPRVLARGLQAGNDRRGIRLVLDHELHHLVGHDLVVLLVVGRQQFADGQQALPAVLRDFGRLRQQRSLVVDVEHAGRGLGPLGGTRHPVEVVGGA